LPASTSSSASGSARAADPPSDCGARRFPGQAVGAAFAAAAQLGLLAAVLYTAICAGLLALLLTVEALALAYRMQAAKEIARRRRRASVRTLMRLGPHSQAPL
jgi:hypothetical protein